MNNIIPFQFNSHSIRVVTSESGDPQFVGKDVCESLGYADHINAMKLHCRGVAKRHPLPTAGGVQELRVLAESDVMRLIVNSTLPSAEPFERWVFEEVLPSIRKTGAYAMPGAALPVSARLDDDEKGVSSIHTLGGDQQLPADFNDPNFGSVEYPDGKGEDKVSYRVTRDGFTMLAMGFTGKKLPPSNSPICAP
ncbi:MAG: BRO family protein [Pseudomonadota bacterium]|nr:BRO family protein [Pseudomonadota bacterium]MDP1905667.1 BRO family protein [Pseudomonadota bacterium]MDP2353337.1 BRO family protein [Pseudomonadota bacterium]